MNKTQDIIPVELNSIADRVARIKSISDKLCQGLYEREEVIRLALLTAIAGESIFLLGPPGVGKSLIARRLKYAFADGQSFEYLMTRFSTPDEVFGPISIRKLKEEDKYERITEKYMPDASVVFLDEIWKASSSIQNALLTIINERVYRNGQQEVPVNIRAILTASNELPPAGENFGPLWDRLLVRYDVQGIQRHENFVQMITDTSEVYDDPIPANIKITDEELKEWDQAINAIKVGDEVIASLQMIRNRIEKWNERKANGNPILVFDRRWKKILRLMRTSAFLNGREEVDLMDMFLLLHCLWDNPAQIAPLKEIIAKTIREHGYSISLSLSNLHKEIEEFEREVDKELNVVITEEEKVLSPIDDVWYEMIKPDDQFEGKRLKVNDFNRLQIDRAQVTNFYDDGGKLVNRLNAKKGKSAFSLIVTHNSREYTYSLQTHIKEKQKKVQRQPHELIVRHWNQRFNSLSEDLNNALSKIQDQKNGPVQQLEQHLFTDRRLAPLVKANLMEVEEQVKELKLRLDKLHFSYES